MKSTFAINFAIGSRSFAEKGRSVNRGVCKTIDRAIDRASPAWARPRAARRAALTINTTSAPVSIHIWKMPTRDDQYAHPATPPNTLSLKETREAADSCTACHLYKHATRTVFGEGPKVATMMLVGEQPGDSEDVAGKPFAGPAGKIMNRALEEAGIDRKEVYVTNVVKHFKWEPRGKRRIHQKPNSREIAACRPSLQAGL